jgi:predicted nicotinamide N-methyase
MPKGWVGKALTCKKEEKVHQFNAANLPALAKAKVGEKIVVTVGINPADVDTIREQSSNNNVTVKSAAGGGIMVVTVSAARKGKSKIVWTIESLNGKTKIQELEVEFE